MSQHLNLLQPREDGTRSAWVAGAVLTATLMCLAVIGIVRQHELSALKRAIDTGEQKLRDEQAHLQALTGKQGQDVDAALADLKSQVRAAQNVLALTADLGSDKGFSTRFVALTEVHEDGLWLTGIELAKAGKAMRLSGMALSEAAVMRYVSQVGVRLGPQIQGFSQLEVSPVSVVRPAGTQAAGKPAEPPPIYTVAFNTH
jgi:hypothetical protein